MSMTQLHPQTIKARAIAKALELGAGAVAVVAAQPDRTARRRMSAAFRRGDFRTWKYDDAYASRAADPQQLLRGARSVLCVAVPYATPPPRNVPRLRGRVSNYAWSSDYHRRMRELLSAVAREMDEAAGEPVTAVACDTRALAERAFAARAGLGWIGKHTNLISPQLGSFIFLGEILTTLGLPPDAPLRKSCGACRRCVDACPTGALRGDYTIDAGRCISDLTQRTDSIPIEMRPLIGDWVWGCDICQLVCPPTQNANQNAGTQWQPRDADTVQPWLFELLALRSGKFKRRYQTTAMGWRGAAVLRRNAAVALGNALDRAAVPPLIESLRRDPHPMVRGHAAWALGRIGSPTGLAALELHYCGERDVTVRNEIRAAVEPFGICFQ